MKVPTFLAGPRQRLSGARALSWWRRGELLALVRGWYSLQGIEHLLGLWLVRRNP